MLNIFFKGNNTVKKSKYLVSGSSSSGVDNRHLLQLASSTLGAANLKNAVLLPLGETEEEWISYNASEFLNQVKLIYGVVSALHCNKESCPSMRAGSKYEFLWCDDAKYKRPTNLAACDYIGLALAQCQAHLDDESIFPTEPGLIFPRLPKYQSTIKTIFKRIFRVYAHLYHHHFQVFTESKVDSLLNTSFKHFIYFVKEFKLLADEDMEPLVAVIAQI